MGVDQKLEGREAPALDGAGLRVAVVCGRFNAAITERLLDGVVRGLAACQVADEDVVVEWVPGAFEVPFASMAMIHSGEFDAVIGLGCVIRGDTSHYDFVAGECARGLQDVGLATGVPVIFGVLTTENRQQAEDRSEGPGGHNVGEEGAHTAVEMALLARRYVPADDHDHDHDGHDHDHDHDGHDHHHH